MFYGIKCYATGRYFIFIVRFDHVDRGITSSIFDTMQWCPRNKKKMFLVGWGAHLFGACIKRKLCICVYVHLHDCVIIIIFFLHTEI